jgi:spermidine synthase
VPSIFHEHDPLVPIKYSYEVQRVLYSSRTKFGSIKVLESSFFGRMLVLNNVVQLTEWDEYLYHEMLVHVPLHANPEVNSVLIVGGGDGGSLREVLKHQNVKRVTLVEIDDGVIEVSKKFLPALSTGFLDSRVNVVIADGADFLASTQDRFDVIILDSTDPVGVSKSLFSDDFFSLAFSSLNSEGIFVTQSESLHFHHQFIHDILIMMGRRFKHVGIYSVPLATYTGNWWTFSIGSKKYDPCEPRLSCKVTTRYYAEDVHRQSFLPESLYKKLIGTV